MSADSNAIVKVLEKISEISERSVRIETKLTSVEREMEYIKDEDKRQNELLAQHILGVKSNTFTIALLSADI